MDTERGQFEAANIQTFIQILFWVLAKAIFDRKQDE